MSITIKFKKLHPDAKLPTKGDGDIGWDLYYCGEDTAFEINESILLETGISWEPPEGYHGLIWDRSGLAVKNLHRLAGVIDQSYRGEIKVCLKHLGDQHTIIENDLINDRGQYLSGYPVYINKGDRIAQLIIQKEIPTKMEWAEEVEQTKRGAGGFGSTGR